jgi:hypothetical protein
MRRACNTLVHMRIKHKSFNTELERNENTSEKRSTAKGNIKEAERNVFSWLDAVI